MNARDAYESFSVVNPDLDVVWTNTGVALARLGRDQEAVEALDRAWERAHLQPFGRRVW